MSVTLQSFFPRQLDNGYRGQRLALWCFAFVVFAKAGQSVVLLADPYRATAGADGVPLSDYPAAAAQAIVASYAGFALLRLVLLAVCVVALIRYRTAVPALFTLLIVQFLSAQALHAVMPTARTGTPPGSIANRVIFAVMLVGLALSLWKRREPTAESLTAHSALRTPQS